MWSATELATANRDLIQLKYDPGKVSVVSRSKTRAEVRTISTDGASTPQIAD